MALLYIGSSYAETHPDSVILEDTLKTYNGSDHALILPDIDEQLTIQDVIAKYKDGQIDVYNSKNSIMLDFNNHPYWVIIPVENNTNNNEWLIDFNDLYNGRSGISAKLLVYEVSQKKIFFDGLKSLHQTNQPIINYNNIPVTLPINQKSVFLLYFYPTDYKKMVISPSFKSAIAQDNPAPFGHYIAEHLFIATCVLSILIVIIGFLITKNIGFIPIILYYLILPLWFIYIEQPIYPKLSGLHILPTLFPLMLAGLAASSAILSTPARYSPPVLRFLLLLVIGGCIMTGVGLGAILPIETSDKSNIVHTASILTLVIATLFLMRNKTSALKPSAFCLSGWTALLLIGQVLSILTSNGIIGYFPATVHANLLIVYPQFIFVFIGVILSIKTEHERQIGILMRQAQKTQAILKARKNKESDDHSRLLRVIEREREIMEELRGRESERTDEMRKAKINADEANQAKSAFLAVVSHEIRTPMTGVMGMVRMLEDTDLTKEQKDYVLTIKDSGDAMLTLLNDILDFSKIEGAGLDLENIEFDINRVLNGVVMLMKGHADQKKINLILNVDNKIPHTLYGDPTRLRQIFLNLVGNALKFTSKGHVALSVRLDSATDDTCAIYFSVEDTGIGISENAQKNLFTPFSQADSSIARKYGGTGLGLAISKMIIEAMGGEIKLKSHEGAGTTFFFTLPFHTKRTTSLSTPAAIQEDAPIHHIKPMRFLLVDDNEINQKVIKGFLDRDHHKSEITSNGPDTLAILDKDTKFDAVFLDIEMPGMSGIEVADNILKNEKIASIPLIAMTGNVSNQHLNQYKDAGFFGHLAKPIEPEKLTRLILSIVNKQSPFKELVLESDESEQSNEKSPETSSRKSLKPALGKTLDENMITGLKEGIGAKQTKELIADLFMKADEILEQFNEILIEKSKESARMRAHELRGMAANFGLKAISDKAAEIETIAKDIERPFEDLIPHIKDLSTLIERSQIAIDDFFDL